MRILGMMSGTSLDGLDMALCRIEGGGYAIEAATTVPYTEEWRRRLSSLGQASAFDYAMAHAELGHYMGREAHRFLVEEGLAADAIASHGHTIFHQPEYGLTTQIGDGDAIAAETGLPVVSNFRTLDVALGGQGAPLVPTGDELFFGEYDACLNLGGIANISYREGGRRKAYDICPCNMALNRLAAQLGLPYDPQGENARRGHTHTCLLAALDNLPYYADEAPKSLGKEWFDSQFWPVVEAAGLPAGDALATVSAHIALQIARAAQRQPTASLLVTGGGAYNSHLIDLLQQHCPSVAITVPDPLIVDYKEALVFALLGYLRLNHRVNTLKTVTGACADSVGGTVSGLTVAGQEAD